MTVTAILWDLDGVLVNSMEFHYRAYSEVLSQRGVKLSREKYLKEMIGLRNYTILRRVLGDLPDDEIMRLAEQKEEAFRRLVQRAGPAAAGRRRVSATVRATPGSSNRSSRRLRARTSS